MNRLRIFTLRTRLLLAFALILALFAGYCVYALTAMQRLGALTEEIYDHPLQVSNAALRAGSGVSKIHLDILAIANSTSPAERLEVLQSLREEEAVVTANLDLIQRQILGQEGMQLLRDTRALYDAWRPLRQEIIGLAENGQRQAATEAMFNRGAPHVAKLRAQMQQLNAYARNKADGFMQSAREAQQKVLRDTLGGFVSVTLVAALIAFLVLRSILEAVGSLKTTMAAITTSGTLEKANLDGRDELTEMGGYFNRLVDRLQGRFWLREGAHVLGRRLAEGTSPQELAEQGLATVARELDACAGAVYLCDGEDHACRREAVYALAEGDLFAPHFAFGEGIVGQVARERQPILLCDIDGAGATVVSGTLRQSPRSICVLPLLHEEQLVGVLEVAGFAPFTDLQREYLDVACGIIATALAVARQNERIRQLLEETRTAHQALEEKTGALDRSNEELTAANTEMRSQSEELKAQTEELRGQTAELLRQRALVEEADRLKSEFLSNMSHELRTPLNSIMALSQLMISRGVGCQPEQEIQYLQVIERNGRHLLSLINDILDLAKIESGRMDLHLTDFDPAQPVARALETVAPLAREKGLPLRFERPALPPLRADEDKVHQILLNLLSNAVKFTDTGAVEVSVSAEEEQLRFTVRDTGIGIDAEQQQQIFDEFRQVDGSTTRRHEGTGLGLAICQKLAQLLGGRIELASTPGEGSTFSLLLPLRSGEEPAALPAPATVPLPAPGAGPTILVIDDEIAVRQLLQRHLSQAGYQVALAGGGREGLALARQLQPAAITLDVMMPELDGWEVIRQLKADPATAHIPVVVVSLSDDRATGIALGAAGYVVKPVDRNLLLAEIAKIAARRPVRRVLVVDDDPWARTRVEAVLGEKQFQVEAAGGGEEGLAKALAQPPDALILDLMMPGMDGFTVLERLRQTPATHDLPVIILTAKDLSSGERARLQQSVHRVITKGGMDRDELLREIETALATIDGAAPPSAAPMPTVLVVEDNPVAVLQIRSALEERGYDVDVATGGAEALACVAARIPDAIVLDLMMPEIDGFQVLEEIRSTPRTATLPVLVLTAKELTAEDRSRLSHNNISQLVQKGSLDREQLVACVDRMFRPAAASPAVPPRPAASSPSVGPILVVEDNPDNRFTLGAILDQAGYPHVAVTDGAQAVQAAADHCPRLILMDMQLPVLSGLEAAARIKAEPALQAIPIVALTAKAMKGDREAILAQGCDDYLAKPLEPAALLALLGKWLGPV